MATTKRPESQSAREVREATTYLEVVGTDERIVVPDDPDGERAAVAADPGFQRRLTQARQDRAQGRTVSLSALVRQMDAEEGNGASAPKHGHPPQGEPQGRFLVRVPASLHRDLLERAEREHTTLNQLVLTYLSRGIGQDEGAAARPAE